MQKVSIVMAAYNSESTIKRAIESFITQDYDTKELIVVDGKSQDRTCQLVEDFHRSEIRLYSERDTGIYDAINRGIELSSGSVIGILHSNDTYPHNRVLSEAMKEIASNNLDAVYADVEFFKSNEKDIIRRYSSRRFTLRMLKYGVMPAHPTLFLQRSVFDRNGYYRTDLRIAADFDFIARTFKSPDFKWKHVPRVWMKMKVGGASTSGLKSIVILNKEIMKSCKNNGINTSWAHILVRYSWKLFELSFLRRLFFLR